MRVYGGLRKNSRDDGTPRKGEEAYSLRRAGARRRRDALHKTVISRREREREKESRSGNLIPPFETELEEMSRVQIVLQCLNRAADID